MIITTPLDQHTTAVAALFHVFPEYVTRAMIARVRVRAVPIRPVDATWYNCPTCKQSATGLYLGAPGCSRCGWYPGGIHTTREIL